MSFEEIRLLSVEQYFLFCALGQIKELERRRDFMIACLTPNAEKPGLDVKHISNLISKLEVGESFNDEEFIDTQLDATLGNAISVESDSALESLGFERA